MDNKEIGNIIKTANNKAGAEVEGVWEEFLEQLEYRAEDLIEENDSFNEIANQLSSTAFCLFGSDPLYRQEEKKFDKFISSLDDLADL